MASTTSSRRSQRKRRNASFARFLRWWGRELAALVPPALRPRNRPAAGMLWVGLESGALILWRLAGQKRSEIGRIDLASGDAADHKIAFHALHGRAGTRPLGICLPPSQVLRKEVVLPLAAAENLAQVLGFELGRQTPFTADQAYYDQRPVREDRGNNRLHALLGVVPRSAVDEILAHLSDWGVTPNAVAVSDELESGGDCLNLLPPRLRLKPRRTGYWLAAAMAGVTLALFAALLVIPLWQKREVVIALHPVVDRARQQADAVDTLKREQERLLAEYNFPTEHKLAIPAKVALLEEVTRILPDNTWLEQLDIHGGEISMLGHTSSSAKLIGLFEQSALLENASFKSPLVKVQGSEERFELTAAIKPVDLAEALVLLRGLHENDKPAKAAGRANKRSAKR
jgi:general secretion pathway protein L